MPKEPAAPPQADNLFRDLPERLPDELFTTLVEAPSLRIVRIVSTGQRTPEGEWYDQDTDEWVVLLKGRARLGFDGGRADVEMAPGDHVRIPARCRHCILWTAEDEPTVWLAVHYGPPTATG